MKKQIEFGIYIWRNIITGTVLVGQTGSTKGFTRRKQNYLSYLRKGTYRNKYFQNSWNKYGEESFLFEIIEQHQDNSILTEREQFWVDFYRNQPNGVYNLTGPVEASRRGTKSTDDHREKISNALKGRKHAPHSDETRKKMSESRTGYCVSEATRAKISASHQGKPCTDEVKEKLSILNKGKNTGPKSEETKKKMSEAQKGKKRGPQSYEARQKKSKALNGIRRSDETRAKMREAAKLREAKKRAARQVNLLEGAA